MTINQKRKKEEQEERNITSDCVECVNVFVRCSTVTKILMLLFFLSGNIWLFVNVTDLTSVSRRLYTNTPYDSLWAWESLDVFSFHSRINKCLMNYEMNVKK